jgi:hypothetical protein
MERKLVYQVPSSGNITELRKQIVEEKKRGATSFCCSFKKTEGSKTEVLFIEFEKIVDQKEPVQKEILEKELSELVERMNYLRHQIEALP